MPPDERGLSSQDILENSAAEMSGKSCHAEIWQQESSIKLDTCTHKDTQKHTNTTRQIFKSCHQDKAYIIWSTVFSLHARKAVFMPDGLIEENVVSNSPLNKNQSCSAVVKDLQQKSLISAET